MAMDSTDRKLVNGLIVTAVLAGVLYFYPFGWPIEGYQKLMEKENVAREQLTNADKSYTPFYGQIRKIYYDGRDTKDTEKQVSEAVPMNKLKLLYKQANEFHEQQIEAKKASDRIAFPSWTDIPEADKRIPGHYFRFIWEKHQRKVEIDCKNANVELADQDIVFKRISGMLPDEAKTKEYLRELHITEKIIELCVQAKQNEENWERSQNKKPEAYMRIMQVEPRDSEPTGPTALKVNPHFDPFEKNPASPKFRKYTVQTWPVFVQEYPVRIQIICDTNSFVRFLHSVRSEGQFLVIRQLEILSPFLDDSVNDKSEEREFKGEAADEKAKKRWPQKDEQVVVTMNVSGMDFFNPAEYPKGLYEKKVDTAKAVPGSQGRRRVLGQSPKSVTP